MEERPSKEMLHHAVNELTEEERRKLLALWETMRLLPAPLNDLDHFEHQLSVLLGGRVDDVV